MPRDALWYLLNEEPSAQFTAASMWEGVPDATQLDFGAPARVRNAAETRAVLDGSNSDAELLEVLQQVSAQLAEIRDLSRRTTQAMEGGGPIAIPVAIMENRAK